MLNRNKKNLQRNNPPIIITKAIMLLGDYQLSNGSYKFEVYPRGKKRYIAVEFTINENVENNLDYIYVTPDEMDASIIDYQHGGPLTRGFIFPISESCPLNQLKIAAFKINKEASAKKLRPIRQGMVYTSDLIINHINPHLLKMYNYLCPIKVASNLQFFQPIKKPLEIILREEKATDIPEEFCCAISFDIMNNPVLCTLDDRFYEEAIITEWLTKHRKAPYTLKHLNDNQNPKEVLKRDNNLKELIQEFRINNPHLFEEIKEIKHLAKKKKI
jgi:hypothetical protein